jgi:hypothetical protein
MALRSSLRLAVIALLAVQPFSCSTPATSPAPTAGARPMRDAEALAFSVDAGGLDNHFYRRGPIAAHVLAASGETPRILFAFPAGNCGAGLWFEAVSPPARLTVEGALTPVERADGMRGVSARIRVEAPALRVRGAALGSVRALREYAASGTLPAGFEARVDPVVPGEPVVVARTMLHGRHVALLLAPEDGASVTVDASGRITLAAAPGRGELTVRATGLTDEAPLTPIPAGELLTGDAVDDPQARDALAFLSDRDKLVAGSWRFLTYFGRDTLIALELLMPVLHPAPIEAGLGAVLERLGPDGQVAHEEAIGEWAAWLHRREGGLAVEPPAPVYDYGMVDDDFLLAPALAHYLLDTPRGRARAASFLDRRTSSGPTFREGARRNLERVLALAAPFAAAPSWPSLVSLRPGSRVGDWRDSENGLGGGRYPYDVNAALVPAALEAAARLLASPHFQAAPAASLQARAYAEAWRGAAALFRVEVPEAAARARVAAEAAALGLDPAAAVATLDGPVVFDALALDAAGGPVPVLHSDVGFRWLYADPPPAELERAAGRLFAPFPAGLWTPIGVVVANPAFAADPALRALFTRRDYHGTVVWSWQQALLAAGLRRQLARADLPASTRAALERAEAALWQVIRSTERVGMATAELWSFAVEDAKLTLVPFGQGHGDADESNAIQLWSTVYLAVQPSRPAR